MDNWLILLKTLPQDNEQLKAYLNTDIDFIQFLKGKYPNQAEIVRRQVERNLATRKGLRFIDLLIGHREPRIRQWGLELVELLPAEMRIPRLLKAFGDKNEEIKMEAADKLSKIKSLEVVNELINGLAEERWLPARIAQALSSMGEFSIPALKELSQNNNEKLRGYAVEILAQMATGEAGRAVAEFLTDNSPAVRKAAIRAMEGFPELASPPLLSALFMEREVSTKIQIIRTLTKLGLNQARPAIERELSASDPKLVQTARKALDVLR